MSSHPNDDCDCYGYLEETGGTTTGVPLCPHEEAANDTADLRKAEALALVPPSPRRRKRVDPKRGQ